MIKKLSALALTCLFLFNMTGCDENDPICACDPTADIRFSNVESYQWFWIPEPSTMVITEEIDWLNLWIENWTQEVEGEKTAPPDIDFNTEMVIVISWGMSSGCHNMSESIKFLLLENDTLYVVSTGLEDLGLCEMVVYPLHMVKTAKRDAVVEFIGDLPDIP
ncbi:MAG: hypothetical protein KAV42_04345 [Candidatus Krumholzibacteria bacterium]|nr:hypothetical protein [Candidatus Krumholzibacteria bacterium]